MNSKQQIMSSPEIDWNDLERFFKEILSILGFVEIKTIGKRVGRTSVLFQANLIDQLEARKYSRRKPNKLLYVVEVQHTSRISVETLARVSASIVLKGASGGCLITTGRLTSVSKAYAKRINEKFDSRLRIWDRDFISHLLKKQPQLAKKYSDLLETLPK